MFICSCIVLPNANQCSQKYNRTILVLLCSHQTVKQRPRQYVSRKPAKETARPEFKLSTEISARVEETMACLQRRRCDADRVEEDGGEDSEDEVE